LPEHGVLGKAPPPSNKYNDDFDIVALMNSARDPDTGLIRDLKIDDSDLRLASSFYDFAHTTIGSDAHPPWAVQMWIGLMLYGEVCPVCSRKNWLDLNWFVDNVPKDMPSAEMKGPLKILRHGVCPKCKMHKRDLIKNHGLVNYIELVNVLGQRSGKSASAAFYSAYHTHWYLKFPRLATLTPAMQKSTELTGTFVSLTFNKAFSLLWTPYVNIINESRWFTDYKAMLTHHGQMYDTELFRMKDEYIKFYHKGLRMYPSGPNSQTLRGDTRILAIIDELGLFRLPTGNDEEDEKSERANADEAHKSLTNSLATVQSVHQSLIAQGINCPPALMLGVSSPISMRDKVMRVLAESRTPEGKKMILGVNLPTWKVNPFLNRDSPVIVKAYLANKEKAERDFGANPPRVSSVFLRPGQVKHELFCLKNTHVLKYMYDKPELIYGTVAKVYSPKYPSVLCLDAGHVNNSFCLVGAHFDFEDQKTKVTTVLEIMPHDDRNVDFNLLYQNVILPVAKDINAVAILADQWQSLDILSRARADLGLEPRSHRALCVASQYSPKRRDFDSVASMLENGSYQFPNLSKTDYDHVCTDYIDFRTLREQAIKHLFLQMMTVKDVGPARCPEKGEGFTDDIFRAFVLTSKIHHDKIMDRLRKAHEEKWFAGKGAGNAMPMPVYVSRGLY